MLNSDVLAQLKSDLRAKKERFTGQVKGTSGRFGFVTLDDGRELFLPPDEMDKVLPGDRVQVTIEVDPKNSKRQSAVVESLEESTLNRLLGRITKRGKHLFLEPDHPRLKRWGFIPPKQKLPLEEGQYVASHVSEHPFAKGRFQVTIDQVIGDEHTRGIESLYALSKQQLNDQFSEAELNAAAHLQPLADTELERDDLTDLAFITIDNASTQDMDDALYAEPLGEGWRLYVAIADPSAFIAPDSELDLCARQRATSIYLPGRTVPMLPPALSEELCSLKAGEERLSLTCIIDVTANGALSDYRFRPTRIRSRAKLSYPQVSAWLDDQDNDLGDQDTPLIASLAALKSLHQALNANRELHAILFEDRPDFRFELDEQLKLVEIHREERNSAQKLVEECMIAANLCTSRFLADQPQGLFICHPGFKPDRWETVCQLVNEHLPEFDVEQLKTVAGYKLLLTQLEQRDDEAPLKSILARNLERSELSYTPAPHYGLGFESYTTFTSPIRKYQDLCVHRMIKSALGAPAIDWSAQAELPGQLQETIRTTRRASNEAQSWLSCDYISSHYQSVFDAHIIGVNPSGFNVRLDANGIVGFVTCKSLGQKLSFEPNYHRLHNDQCRFELDQCVQVRLLEANSQQRRILFQLADS